MDPSRDLRMGRGCSSFFPEGNLLDWHLFRWRERIAHLWRHWPIRGKWNDKDVRRETKDFADRREETSRWFPDRWPLILGFLLHCLESSGRLIHTSSIELDRDISFVELNISSAINIHSTGETEGEISISLEIDLLQDTVINIPSAISIPNPNWNPIHLDLHFRLRGREAQSLVRSTHTVVQSNDILDRVRRSISTFVRWREDPWSIECIPMTMPMSLRLFLTKRRTITIEVDEIESRHVGPGHRRDFEQIYTSNNGRWPIATRTVIFPPNPFESTRDEDRPGTRKPSHRPEWISSMSMTICTDEGTFAAEKVREWTTVENVRAMNGETVEEVFERCCSNSVLDRLDVSVGSTRREEEDRHWSLKTRDCPWWSCSSDDRWETDDHEWETRRMNESLNEDQNERMNDAWRALDRSRKCSSQSNLESVSTNNRPTPGREEHYARHCPTGNHSIVSVEMTTMSRIFRGSSSLWLLKNDVDRTDEVLCVRRESSPSICPIRRRSISIRHCISSRSVESIDSFLLAWRRVGVLLVASVVHPSM